MHSPYYSMSVPTLDPAFTRALDAALAAAKEASEDAARDVLADRLRSAYLGLPITELLPWDAMTARGRARWRDAANFVAELVPGDVDPLADPASKVVSAWDVPGPSPEIHHRAKRKLRSEWPALAGTLDLLSSTARRNPEPIK